MPPEWQKLGLEGGLAIAMLWVVLNFVLKYAAQRRETPQSTSAGVNGKSGELSVSYWEKSISGMIEASIDKDVVPKLDDILTELRVVHTTLNDMRPRRR